MRSLIFLIFVGGCTRLDPAGGLAVPALDYDEFVCAVQPVLVKRCSYIACHGHPDHALRLFSPGKLREGDTVTRAQRDAPLTAHEIELNFQSAVGLASQPTLLLQKPVKAVFGGGEHHGVGVFPSDPDAHALADDPEWHALADWVGGKAQPRPVTADCQQTFDTLGLTPR